MTTYAVCNLFYDENGEDTFVVKRVLTDAVDFVCKEKARTEMGKIVASEIRRTANSYLTQSNNGQIAVAVDGCYGYWSTYWIQEVEEN